MNMVPWNHVFVFRSFRYNARIMTTLAFQSAAIAELKGELARGEVPFGDIQEFARQVLKICGEHPAGLPDSALKPLIAEFPGLSRTLVAAVKIAEAHKVDKDIQDLRSKLSE